MTSYAPTYTPRYRVKYAAAGVEHTIQIRGPRGADYSAMVTRGSYLQNIFGQFASRLADDFHYISADVALTDEDVWAPATTPAATTGLKAVADFALMQKATGTTFSGRATGSKARLTAYGIFWPLLDIGDDSENGIVTGVEDADVAAAASACTAHFNAGSGNSATFYNQATLKVNDLLLKKIRRGTIS